MRNITGYLILWIILLPSTILATDCKRCDVNVVKTTELQLQNLSIDRVANFLCTLGPQCHTNIEYSEYSNEMLFKVLEKYPNQFIKAMRRKGIDTKYVYKRLSEPLVYESIETLKKIVLEAKGDRHVKQSIMDALNKAGI